MIKEPETTEEKIQYLKDCAPYVVLKAGAIIYGQYTSHENYFLCADGKISTRRWGGGTATDRMEIEEFAERFGEKGLNYAIKNIKLRIRTPKNSP